MKFFVFLFLTLAGFVEASEHLVQNGKELEKAAKNATPGDTIVLSAKGTWKDVSLKLKLRSVSVVAEEAGKVIFSGRSSIAVSGQFVVIDGLTFQNGSLEDGHILSIKGDNCRVTRCAFIDYNPEKATTRYHWISLYGHQHRVDRCRFSGQTHSGNSLCIWLEGDQFGNHRIDHNHFGPRPRGVGNGFEVIRIGDSDSSLKNANCIVTKNLFESCDGEIELISNKSCGNTYLANTIANSSGCLTLRHGNNCLVARNIIDGGGKKETGGIRVIGENHIVRHNHIEATTGRADGAISISAGVANAELNQYAQVKNLRVEGNTLFNNTKGGNFCVGHGLGSRDRTLPPENVTFIDNREKPSPTEWTAHRLTPFDVGPDSVITPHPAAIPGTHPVGEVDNLDNTAWTVPSPKSLAGIVLDETDAILEGDWQYSTHTPPYVGVGYLHDQKSDKGKKSVTWNFDPPKSGRYRVELSHCYNVRRATNTPVLISHADGETEVKINQQETPPVARLFRPVGEYRFKKGSPGTVRISNHGTSSKQVVIADAVRFIELKD